jgi:hypothetical protein
MVRIQWFLGLMLVAFSPVTALAGSFGVFVDGSNVGSCWWDPQEGFKIQFNAAFPNPDGHETRGIIISPPEEWRDALKDEQAFFNALVNGTFTFTKYHLVGAESTPVSAGSFKFSFDPMDPTKIDIKLTFNWEFDGTNRIWVKTQPEDMVYKIDLNS